MAKATAFEFVEVHRPTKMIGISRSRTGDMAFEPQIDTMLFRGRGSRRTVGSGILKKLPQRLNGTRSRYWLAGSTRVAGGTRAFDGPSDMHPDIFAQNEILSRPPIELQKGGSPGDKPACGGRQGSSTPLDRVTGSNSLSGFTANQLWTFGLRVPVSRESSVAGTELISVNRVECKRR